MNAQIETKRIEQAISEGHNIYVRSIHGGREHVLYRTMEVRVVNGQLQAKSMIAGVWFEVRLWCLRDKCFGASISGFNKWPEQA